MNPDYAGTLSSGQREGSTGGGQSTSSPLLCGKCATHLRVGQGRTDLVSAQFLIYIDAFGSSPTLLFTACNDDAHFVGHRLISLIEMDNILHLWLRGLASCMRGRVNSHLSLSLSRSVERT